MDGRLKSFSVGRVAWLAFVLAFASLAAVASPAASAAAGEQQRVAIPSYFYPETQFSTDKYWSQMESASPTVGLAVINPDSGPGAAPNADYADQVASSEAAGLDVIGYVYTSYANTSPDANGDRTRTLAAAKADIDRYYAWYGASGLDGIFLDEVTTAAGPDTNSCTAANPSGAANPYPYYEELYGYIKAKGGKVVLNPGTHPSECYMRASDIVVNFESAHATYANDYPANPAWVSDYAPSRFWHLVYGSSGEAEMRQDVALSQQRHAGWVYVTPDGLPNPWDSLPTEPYWGSELSAVNAAAAPAGPTLDLDAASDSGLSSTDNLTNDATPSLAGVADPNASVKVYDGTALLGTAQADTMGAWRLTAAALANGPHSFTASDASSSSAPLVVTVDLTAPTVASVTPTNGATSVSRGSNVTATFSEAMDPTSLNPAAFALAKKKSTVAATVNYDPTAKKAVLDLSRDLASRNAYTATIKTGAKDAAGNALATTKTWKFKTAR